MCDVAIVVHAVTATVALVAALFAVTRTTRVLSVYLACMVAMLVALGVAVLASWATLDVGTQVLYTALGVLGIVVVGWAVQAYRHRPREGAVPVPAYRARLGGTIIALVDAFLVVLVLDLGAPGWAVLLTGVGIAAVGHVVLAARLRATADLPVGRVRAAAG